MDVLGTLFSNDTLISTYDLPLVARRTTRMNVLRHPRWWCKKQVDVLGVDLLQPYMICALSSIGDGHQSLPLLVSIAREQLRRAVWSVVFRGSYPWMICIRWCTTWSVVVTVLCVVFSNLTDTEGGESGSIYTRWSVVVTMAEDNGGMGG